MIKKYLLLKDNIVDNVVVVDSESGWSAPRTHTMLEQSDDMIDATIGAVYDPIAKTFAKPVVEISYLELRKAAYPEIGDQLDAILKQFEYMKQSEQLVLEADLDAIIQDWQAVKTLYPKPVEEISK